MTRPEEILQAISFLIKKEMISEKGRVNAFS